MQNGIYHVRFSSAGGVGGEGLVVIKDGSVNGGDNGYLYQGRLTAEAGGQVQGQLQVKRWNRGHVSVFGPLDNFALVLTGQTTNDGFAVGGGVPGQPGLRITISGRKIAEVV